MKRWFLLTAVILLLVELFVIVLLKVPVLVDTREHMSITMALYTNNTPENRIAYQKSLQKQKEIEVGTRRILMAVALINGGLIILFLYTAIKKGYWRKAATGC